MNSIITRRVLCYVSQQPSKLITSSIITTQEEKSDYHKYMIVEICALLGRVPTFFIFTHLHEMLFASSSSERRGAFGPRRAVDFLSYHKNVIKPSMGLFSFGDVRGELKREVGL